MTAHIHTHTHIPRFSLWPHPIPLGFDVTSRGCCNAAAACVYLYPPLLVRRYGGDRQES